MRQLALGDHRVPDEEGPSRLLPEAAAVRALARLAGHAADDLPVALALLCRGPRGVASLPRLREQSDQLPLPSGAGAHRRR
eukprot:5754085-Pyramimonas_sp.AAC.1